MNIKHTILLLSITSLIACSEDIEDNQKSNGQVEELVPVEFSVSDQRTLDFTRAATSIVTFNAGEALKIFVKPDGAVSYADYEYTTASAGQSVNLTPPAPPAIPPYYPPGVGTTVEAYAYYPSTASGTFTVQDDQTSDANYKASDLMYADNRVVTKDGTDGHDHLSMAHQMAQLAITAQAQDGSDINITGVQVIAQKSVTFAPNTANIVTTTGTTGTITALNGAGTGYIVIPPQVINGVIIKVITGGGTDDEIATYAFTGTGTFNSGDSYALNLTVSADQLGFTTAINNWNGVGSVNIIPAGSFTISAIPAQLYTGSEIRPSFTVKKGEELVSSDLYDVVWVNNVNAGKAYIIVTGKGTQEGAVGMTSFTITPANGKIEYAVTSVTKTYGMEPFTNELSNYDKRLEPEYAGNPADGVVSYESSDPTVATVNENGLVTLLKAGSTRITATAANGANYVYSTADPVDNTAYYDLTVNEAAGSITFDYAAPSQTWSPTSANNKYTQAVNNNGDGAVTYSIGSTNTCDATINSSTGEVTFTQSGSVQVIASVVNTEHYTYATQTASYTLTVNKATGFITISPESGTVDAGNPISFNIVTNHGGTISAVDVSGSGRATMTISGATVNVATTSGSACSAIIQVTCAENECYTAASANYTLTINAASDIMRNPLWYMAKTNCAGATSFVNYETTVDALGVKFTWATALSYFTTSSVSITGYHRGEKTMTGGLNNYTGDTWHMPTLQEWLSIYGYKGGRYSSGNSLFRNTIPVANTVVTEDQCVFGYNSDTKISTSYKAYWGTYSSGSNLRYAIRFLGTPYCSIWKYQLDVSNKLCIVSAKLIPTIYESETSKLATTMSNMGNVDWAENESTGTIRRYLYWAGYNSDTQYGHYWVATEDDTRDAYNMLFLSNWLGQSDLNTKSSAMSVRLFRDN